MSRTAVFFLCFLFSGISQAGNIRLNIEVKGLSSNQGKVMAYLHTDPSAFPTKGERAIAKQSSRIDSKLAQLIFNNLEPGVYAVAIFHDENDNGKLDSNWLGVPKEPVGASNDAKGFFGPPKFEDAKFVLKQDTRIEINILKDGDR